MAEVDEVARQVESADFLGRLAERLGHSATSSSAFGEPVERGKVTVIPVSRVIWGLGGGSGGEGDEQGSGGGGGGLVAPLGYIEIRDDGAAFTPLRNLRREVLIAVIVGGVLVGMLGKRRRR